MITKYTEYIKESISGGLHSLMNDFDHKVEINLDDITKEFTIYIHESNEYINYKYNANHPPYIYNELDKYKNEFIKNELYIKTSLDDKALNILYLLIINLYNNGFCDYNIDHKFPNSIGIYTFDVIEKIFTDIRNHLGNFKMYYDDVDMFVSQYIDNVDDFDNLHIRNLLKICNDETRDKFKYRTHAKNFDLI